MKITAVETLVLGTSWRNLIFLKVKTDEGLVGIECTLRTAKKVYSDTFREPHADTS